MRTTWRGLLALLVLFGLVATACGDDDDTSTSDTTAAADDTATDDTASDDTASDDTAGTTAVAEDDAELDLVADGTLTVCSDIPYSPFEFEDEENPGEFTGFDVQVVEAIGGELGLEVEWKDSVFDTILASVAAGDCDMVASAMTITDERKEQALFSEPYFDADQSLLIRAEDAGTYRTLADLAGETIGVQAGTTGQAYAEENTPDGATIKSYEGGEDLFLPLASGEIAAVLQDLPVNNFRATQDDEFVVVESIATGEQYGFAMALENTALLDAVNAGLETIKGDGTYDTIYETWFGTDTE
jgi:polar amino acid transport system substrate-binding protein